MKYLIFLLLLIPTICFSQKPRSESEREVQARLDRMHTLKKGQKDTLIKHVIILDIDLKKHGPQNEKRIEGWIKFDLASFSNPNGVIDYYTLDMKKIPKQYVNRYE